MPETACLWVQFCCGHLVMALSGRDAHRLLNAAREGDCPDCCAAPADEPAVVTSPGPLLCACGEPATTYFRDRRPWCGRVACGVRIERDWQRRTACRD